MPAVLISIGKATKSSCVLFARLPSYYYHWQGYQWLFGAWDCRELHKEVAAGIDEAMARHAKETDKVDLLALKQLKARVNALEQQIVADKAEQLTVSHCAPTAAAVPSIAAAGA